MIGNLGFDERTGAAHLEVAKESMGVASLLCVEDCDGSFDSYHVGDLVDFLVLIVTHVDLDMFGDSCQTGVISPFSSNWSAIRSGDPFTELNDSRGHSPARCWAMPLKRSE